MRPGAIPQFPERATRRGSRIVHDVNEMGQARCGRVLARRDRGGLPVASSVHFSDRPTSCPGCLAARAVLEAQRLAMNAELLRNPHAHDGLCLGGGALLPG